MSQHERNEWAKELIHSNLEQNELYHHGILGMHWGVRRYQPYPSDYKGDGHEIGQALKKRKQFVETLNKTPLVNNIKSDPKFERYIEGSAPSVAVGGDVDVEYLTNMLIEDGDVNPKDVQKIKTFIKDAVQSNLGYNIKKDKNYTMQEILAFAPAMTDLVNKQLGRYIHNDPFLTAAMSTLTKNDIAGEIGKAMRQYYDYHYGERGSRPMARPKGNVSGPESTKGVKVRK